MKKANPGKLHFEISPFLTISPLDFRYYARKKDLVVKLSPYLSEEGYVKYLAKVESALVKVLAKRGICQKKISDEVSVACDKITAKEVYDEEDRIKHNIRALVNCIKKRISKQAQPFVHFTSTSYDIVATADAVRYKDFTSKVLVPKLKEFEKNLIEIAEREKDTVQIGRTHGQFAEPITFGFALAQYVSRFGQRIIEIERNANNLRGKFSGAVGSYNASSLIFDEPEKFEQEIMDELGIKASPTSTQIAEAEFMADYCNSIISAFGVIANLSDDMRHLQRSEIAEIAESFGAEQVGSSTMPQKRNPINFENVKSMWKVYMPRMVTNYLDQISEHQRDLTNSASGRFIGEMLAAFYISVERLDKVMKKLVVDKKNMERNFSQSKDMIIAEPLYILLASYGHPDAHEHVRKLTLESQKTGQKVIDLAKKDSSLKQYFSRFTEKQKDILNNPEKYTGIASRKTSKVCSEWRKKLDV